MTRRGRVLVGLLTAMVALEASLQITAGAVWWWYGRHDGGERRVEGAAGERVVACVGDSFTYGIGASAAAGAYPAQLERVLRARGTGGRTWRVLNRGWPGRNSAEVLQRVPELLAKERPDYVVILVGTNDRWSDAEMERAPPPLAAAATASSSGWVWRVRTVRVLALAGALWRSDTPVPPPPAAPLPRSPPPRSSTTRRDGRRSRPIGGRSHVSAGSSGSVAISGTWSA